MKELYSRELSWLQFNDRVLQEAQDKDVSLIQRLRFLGIFSNNLDEFIKVRVANLIRYTEFRGKTLTPMTSGYNPSELLQLVNEQVQRSKEVFSETYDNILHEMEQHGVHVVNTTNLTTEQKEFCRDYFLSVVSMRLVPLMLRKSVKIPFLPDGKIYLAVKMSNPKGSRFAILQIPVSDASPRFIVLPSIEKRTDVIFLEDIVRLFLDELFFMFNYTSITTHTFKIVRDAALPFDDDVSKSLSQKMFIGLSKREKGRPIRLIYDREMPDDVVAIISKKLGLKNKEQFEAGGRYHLMRDLMKFPKVRPELENINPKPMLHPLIKPFDSIMNVIKKQDILLCYPYHTFKHFIDLLSEAAIDPRVQSISITLYRTASHSKVINALISAAKNGKQVTVLIELKARFDEEQNISNTDLLQNSGVKVVHSLEGLKVHSKLLLIERSEGTNNTKGYAYIGTGNFNENTTMVYSDFGLFTANPIIASDARKVFDFLQNTHKHPQFKQLMVSPYYMRTQIEEIIENEIKYAKKGRKAYFYAKFNALTDEKMIHLLYKASCMGVEIKLIVRGACCLKAGIEGLSETIEVRSIIDQYLEHARLILCCNGGKPRSYLLSADLMTRNLDRRVEVGVPISDKGIHHTLEEYFNIQWRDNIKARRIAPPYENKYVTNSGDKHRSQIDLYNYFKSCKNE